MRRGAVLWRAVLGPSLCALLATCAAADGPPSAQESRPAASVYRLQARGLPAPAAGQIVDFDIAEDRLYLLESDRVLILRRTASEWTEGAVLGRRGAGPGEFTGASGIAHGGGRVAVAANLRLQFFTDAGELLGSRVLELPCPMRRPNVALSHSGIYVHGSCYRIGYATDTVKTVLAWSADTSAFELLAEDVQFTRDGTVGSLFGASQGFTAGSGTLHVFGAGTTNCMWRVQDGAGRPALEGPPAAPPPPPPPGPGLSGRP
jgi:hypothetical protein